MSPPLLMEQDEGIYKREHSLPFRKLNRIKPSERIMFVLALSRYSMLFCVSMAERRGEGSKSFSSQDASEFGITEKQCSISFDASTDSSCSVHYIQQSPHTG